MITSFKYALGLTAKDPISGFEGVIVTRVQHIFGCSTYGLAPTELSSDGQTKKTEFFDEARIEILGDKGHVPGEAEEDRFDDIFLHPIGKEARDKMTGMTGTIAYRVEYLYTCNGYGVLPSIDKEGKSRDAEQYDEGRIEILGDGVAPEEVQVAKRGPLVNRDAPRLR